MNNLTPFLFLMVAAAAVGSVIARGFWPVIGALAFLFFLAAAWRWPLIVFYCLVAYLPFQLALNLTPDIDLMSGRVLILGLFFVWLIRELYQNKKRVNAFFADKVSVWLMVFFLLAAASIIVADNQIWGLRKLLVFASIFPLFWLAQFLIKSEKEQRTLIYVIVGGAIVSSLVSLAQFLGQFIFGREAVMSFWAANVLPLFSGAGFGSLVASNPSWQVAIGGQTIMRAIGLFPDPHTLSFYLGLVFPFVLALLFLGKKKSLALFIVSCLLLAVLLLTFSRGGYFGLLACLAVFFLFAWRFFGAGEKKFFSACFLVMAAILLLVGRPVAIRLASSFNLSEGSNMGRLVIWQDSWEIIKKNPIIGVGLGNYPLAVGLEQNYRSAVTSHNLYLDILAETGLFGLLAWLALIFAAAKGAIKKIDKAPIIALGALSALTYFSVHSFFETAIFNPTVLAFLMIILGLVPSRGSNMLYDKPDKKAISPAALISGKP